MVCFQNKITGILYGMISVVIENDIREIFFGSIFIILFEEKKVVN